jgi:hemoglobin
MVTLYDKYGGYSTVSKLVIAFYKKVVASESLAPYFVDVNLEQLIDHQNKFISDILGGPVKYTGAHLKGSHARLNITDEAFSEIAKLLAETLEDMGVESTDIETILGIVAGTKPDIVTFKG